MPDIRLAKGYCNECGRHVLAVREAPNHPLWFLISVVTLGFGLILWLFTSMKPAVWRCARCGTEQNRNE